MKKILLTIIPVFLLVFSLTAQEGDDILGYWLTQEGDSQVKIFKAKNGKYYGNIKWLDEPNEEDGTPKLDDNNEDPELQQKPIMDLQLLKSFVYDEKDKEYVDGTIYDPKNGKTYKCFMWFEEGDDVTLHVKGFIGISIIGREVEWTREEKLRDPN